MTGTKLPGLLAVVALMVGCSDDVPATATDTPSTIAQTARSDSATAPISAETGFERLDGYTLRGIPFAYYRIPAGLEDHAVIAVAGRIHAREPTAQLILVDDTEHLAAYIRWTRASSAGDTSETLPSDWADEHIVANLQRMLSGSWTLYRGNGYEEMARID